MTGQWVLVAAIFLVALIVAVNGAQPSLAASPMFSFMDDASGFANLNGEIDAAVAKISDHTYIIVATYVDDLIQIIITSKPDTSTPVAEITDEMGVARNMTVTISGHTYIIIASEKDNSIQIINITDHYPPPSSKSLTPMPRDGQSFTLGGANAVATITVSEHTYVLVSSRSHDAVQIIDITDPTTPLPVASVFDDQNGFDALGLPTGIATTTISGRAYTLVGSWDDKAVQIIDITDPTTPLPVASVFDDQNGFDALGGVDDIVTVTVETGTYALVASSGSDKAVQIIDITDPTTPLPVASVFYGHKGFAVSAPYDIDTVTMLGGVYAIVTGPSTVQIIDITDPTTPLPVASVFSGQGGAMLDGAFNTAVSTISDSIYAVVASRSDSAIQIIDITDPTTPLPVASISNGQYEFLALSDPYDVEIATLYERTYAVVASRSDSAIQIIDITDPTTPFPAASIFYSQGGFDALKKPHNLELVTLSGYTYAIVSSDADAIQIIDITDPLSPVSIASVFDGDIVPVDADITYDPVADRPVDVLVYGYNDGVRPITAGHIELLESRGYVVEVSNGTVTAEQVEKASVVVGWGLNVQDAEAREVLTEYVHEGGRLLLLIDTQYSRCGSTERPCWFDFTENAFGFRFDGDIQSGTLFPVEENRQHPIWNEPNMLREFSDWCCDGYVGEITDSQNIKVIATVSGQSYKHGEYTSVYGVPAIVVNDNPAWGGGMVVGAGIDMVAGWRGPDMRMFDNIVGYMVAGPDASGKTPMPIDVSP